MDLNGDGFIGGFNGMPQGGFGYPPQMMNYGFMPYGYGNYMQPSFGYGGGYRSFW